MHVLSRFKAGAILSLLALNISAAVIYDESASPDLSNSGLAPTPLTVSEGENQILGTLGASGNDVDRDYFTFTVPSGLELTAIVILPGTTTGPGASFFGVQSGSQVAVAPDAVDYTGLLGFLNYLPGNGNIITDVGVPGNGATGFVPPLGPGSYSFWLQDTAEGTFNYGLDFQLLSVPENGIGMLGCATIFAIVTGLRNLQRNRSSD